MTENKDTENLIKRHSRDSVVHFFLILAIFVLASGNIYLNNKISNIEEVGGDTIVIEEKGDIVSCDEECKADIKNSVEQSISLKVSDETSVPTAAPTAFPVKTAVPATSKNVSVVNLGSSFSTMSTDWVDVDGSGVFLDINDYGDNAEVYFEAHLKIAHSNGTTYARVFDDTNKIVVSGSEVSVTNKEDLTLVSSGNLPFWRGNNLYKVQIKSLNSFEATYGGGRLKIVH